MPRQPIQSPPPPPSSFEWTPAHTEGLKGLGRGLLQDYQQGMDYLGGLSEHPAVQGLGFLLPLMGGVVTKFPTSPYRKLDLLNAGASKWERMRDAFMKTYGGEPEAYGLAGPAREMEARAYRLKDLALQLKKRTYPPRWDVIDIRNPNETISSYDSPQQADEMMRLMHGLRFPGSGEKPDFSNLRIVFREPKVIKFPSKEPK